MKKIIPFIALLFCNSVFSDSITINKNNSNSIVNIIDKSFKFDPEEKKISFKTQESGNKETFLNYKDFDYVIIGNLKFKTLKLKPSGELNGYFVLAESSNRILISSAQFDEETDTKSYEYHILDNDYAVIESHYVNNSKDKKSAAKRSEIYTVISTYFSDCSKMMAKLTDANNINNPIDNMNMLKVFFHLDFINCN